MSICVVRRRVYTLVYASIYVLSLIDSCVLRRASWRESRKGSLANPLCRSPAFNVKFIKARLCAKDICSETIVHLRQLKQPFANFVMQTYNLQKEEHGKQLLELVVCNYLKGTPFWTIMPNQEWKNQFNLMFRPIFDAEGV